MTRYLLDADVLTLYLRHDPVVFAAVLRHLAAVGVSIITVEELWDGWQAAARKAKTPDEVAAAYDRLTDTVTELRTWPVVSFGAAAVRRYAALKKQKLNVGANDLKLAAIGLEAGAAVVTRNVRDFGRVPGLAVENWAGAT